MTQDLDSRIVDLMSQNPPAVRDPLFRVSVIQRMERVRYRRRLIVLLSAAALGAVIAALGAVLGSEVRQTIGAVLVGGVLVASYFVVGPAMAQLIARFQQ